MYVESYHNLQVRKEIWSEHAQFAQYEIDFSTHLSSRNGTSLSLLEHLQQNVMHDSNNTKRLKCGNLG